MSDMKSRRTKARIATLGVALLVASMAMLTCGEKSDSAAEIDPTPRWDSVASADSVMIHYEVRGVGEPALVFIHGWCCDVSYWEHQLPAFDSSYRVVAIDLSGHGRSGLNRAEWTIPSFGRDVEAVVNDLGLEKVILIGHSMGGPVCIQASEYLGDRVLGIVGVDTFQDMAAEIPDEQRQAFIGGMEMNFVGFTSQFVTMMFQQGEDSAIVNRVRDDMSSAPAEVGIGAMKGLMDFNVDSVVMVIQKPIRAVNADMWPTNVEGNQQIASSFEITLMEGHGHFLHMTAPEAFNLNLASYITELSVMPGGH